MNTSPIILAWNSIEILAMTAAIWWLVGSIRRRRRLIRNRRNGVMLLVTTAFVVAGWVRLGISALNLAIGVAALFGPPSSAAATARAAVLIACLMGAQIGVVSLTLLDLGIRRRLEAMPIHRMPNEEDRLSEPGAPILPADDSSAAGNDSPAGGSSIWP